MTTEQQTILFVDNSPIAHDIYGKTLGEAGYSVRHAHDGVEAINEAFAHPPQLILLDIHMPKITGYQVCRLLKQHAATSHIPIILFSSDAPPDFVENAAAWSAEVGADGFLEKDNDAQLLPTVADILKAQPTSSTASPQVKPITEIEIMAALSGLLDKELYRAMQLQRKNTEKDALIAAVSHEIRSPLAIIQGNAEFIKRSMILPAESREFKMVESTIRTTKRLNRLVSDLLDMGKFEAGRMPINMEPVALGDILAEVRDAFDIVALQKGITFTYDVSDVLPTITGDHDRLSQVLINLVNNAVKFTPTGGNIALAATPNGSMARLSVADSGPGLSPEEINKIFQVYERVGVNKAEGTGLGLPIAREIVTLHGGRLWVDSVEGSGSTFFVELPLEQ
jgi:signal transduction histidine kinase